ncbi:palmitoyltransferase akr1 [Ascosphaera aggregata]|nr:palmitoyltransferase akr1 [Ascosphaera aggregata]
MTLSTAQGKAKGVVKQNRGAKSPPSTDTTSAGSGSTSITTAAVALTVPGNTKGCVAPPKLSVNGTSVELDRLPGMSGHDSPTPLGEDIMQLARLGETTMIQKLFESGKFDASYKDEEEITPLHWAAINNQYATCKYLLDAGADVNAKGGQSMATPAMWAAQQNHYYVVHLLLERGADPSVRDIQGYNILHLATFSGNAFLLILLLHQEIPIDVPDPQGHTPLMWAAYKGFPVCVDLFLRWGANVNAVDDGGLTPLHWALVRGSLPCISKMLEYDADRFAKTKDGKSPDMVATEIGTKNLWHRSLKDHGYTLSGDPVHLTLGLERFVRNKSLVRRWFFLWPFLMVLGSIYLVSNLPVYVGLPALFIWVFIMQFTAQKVGSVAPPEFRDIQKTPFLAGIFAADPGYVPKLSSRNQQRKVMQSLLNDWIFDDQHFCVMCLNRKPLRSKHCKRYISLLPPAPEASCVFLSKGMCSVFFRDAFTIVLSFWAALQLIWVTLLCCVQLVQISRNQTTYEIMRNRHYNANAPSRAIANAIAAGTTSADATTGQGGPMPPALTTDDMHTHRHGHSHRGCCNSLKLVLGIDTFMATATGSQDQKVKSNPFSQGCFTNCKDFWFDGTPLFGPRPTGNAKLAGHDVNYHQMFDIPLGARSGNSLMVYRSLRGDDAV